MKGSFKPPNTLTPTESGAEALKRGKKIMDEPPSCKNCRRSYEWEGIIGCREGYEFPRCTYLLTGYRRK